MRINPINNNQPNFGIKYTNKAAWNPRLLRAFENSSLLKGIDKKFPEAEVSYSSSYRFKPNNCDKLHTLMVDFHLAKDYVYRWILSNDKEENLERSFRNFILGENIGSLEFLAYTQKESKKH